MDFILENVLCESESLCIMLTLCRMFFVYRINHWSSLISPLPYLAVLSSIQSWYRHLLWLLLNCLIIPSRLPIYYKVNQTKIHLQTFDHMKTYSMVSKELKSEISLNWRMDKCHVIYWYGEPFVMMSCTTRVNLGNIMWNKRC